MLTSDIDNCLSSVPSFVGTFPCNQITPVSVRPAFYVLNTAPLNKTSKITGEHWVSVLLKSDGTGEYFDSFGLPPTQPLIAAFLKRTCPQGYDMGCRVLQDASTRVCGVYCVDYVLSRASGLSLQSYLGLFGPNSTLNDKLVIDRVACRLSARQPSLRSKLKTLLQ